jgi:U6 snRNA-associated Sm-like protein LSm8
MSSYFENLMESIVTIITTEGKVYTGILKSLDQSMNIILNNCYEKIYSLDEGVSFQKIGLYMIRGDNIMIVSEVDENLEKQIDLKEIKAEPLKEVKLHYV